MITVCPRRLVDQMLPFNDPRLGVYAQPTQCFLNPVTGCPPNPPQYAGLVNGLEANDAATFAKVTSRPGEVFYSTPDFCVGCASLDRSELPEFHHDLRGSLFHSAPKRRNAAGPAATRRPYMTQGIRASMEQWGVTDQAAIAAYLAQPAIAYQGGTAGLRQIALQKWIALYTDGVEAWSEWRRTCVPETVKPGPAAVINTVPRRYQYSSANTP